MFRKIEDFAAEWTAEFQLTVQVMNVLTDEALPLAIAEGRRTLGQLAWHLVASLQFMTTLGLSFEAPADLGQAPQSAAVIAQAYSRIGEALLEAIRSQWDDGKLLESQAIAGEEWLNGASLRFAIMHQAHHRGQMTVLMRQAGVRPPELYGPTYESWIDKGLAPRA